jgi:hypothetical protein
VTTSTVIAKVMPRYGGSAPACSNAIEASDGNRTCTIRSGICTKHAVTTSELRTCVLTSGRPAPHLTVVNDVNGTMILSSERAVAVRQGMEPASVLQSRRGGCC